MLHRRGLSLLELLVVIAITGVLLGLLLPAVQKVRLTALRMECANQLRQIVIATHNFGATHESRLPSMDGHRTDRGYGLLMAVLSYVDGGYDVEKMARKQGFLLAFPHYISPADPSYDAGSPFSIIPVSSYAINAQAFAHSPNLARTFRDGTSNTIAFAEHYSTCQQRTYSWQVHVPQAGLSRRATFADGGPDMAADGSSCGDFYPAPGKIPTLTFQVAPALRDCDLRLAQTPHRAGMLVALADGSVRILDPGISAATYWALVTPSGGEILGKDWDN